MNGLAKVLENCKKLYFLNLTCCDHINKEDLVSLFTIKNTLCEVYIDSHDTLDTQSAKSILESTFKHRPDESQGGLIKEKIQKLIVVGCNNLVDHQLIEKHLNDNENSYFVEYNGLFMRGELFMRCVYVL